MELEKLINLQKKGKSLSTTSPNITKKTITTRRLGKDAGAASTAARLVHVVIDDLIDTGNDRLLKSRLTQAMLKVVYADTTHKPGRRQVLPANLALLRKFRISGAAPMVIKPVVKRNPGGLITVKIPKPINQFPAGIAYMEFRVMAICPDFKGRNCRTVLGNAFIMGREDDVPEIVTELPAKCVQATMIVVEATAYKMRGGNLLPMDYKQHNAVEIVSILKPITIVPRKRRPLHPYLKGKPSAKTAAYWEFLAQQKNAGGQINHN